MKPKTIVTIILGICLVLMAATLAAYRLTRPATCSAELIGSSSCSVCASPSHQQKCIGCGMSMAEVSTPYVINYLGKEYRYCCKECAATFEKDPEAFLAKHPDAVRNP